MSIETIWADIVAPVVAGLNYKLFEIDGHGVSVAKLLSGLFLLALGYAVSVKGSSVFDERVLSRLNMESSLRYVMRRLIFYFLLFIFSMFTLRSLNVPITIFTVLGGALAVGIGFGSQNLVNNFISGVLVMAERPVRVGDFIEVDGVSGIVASIGIRTTTVVAPTNSLVTIPNTSFVEKNLVNWTKNLHVLTRVTVGVAYGSDVHLVQRLLLSAVGDVKAILKNPEPWVLFTDFGDNALIFEVLFYVQAADYPVRRQMESQVRFRVQELFTEHRVSIPFPQRDLHVDLSAPVSVRVLN